MGKNNKTNACCSDKPRQEEIRRVAEKLYIKRGRVPGHDLDDWLEAERIVKSGSSCCS